jgi:hypothetical protein
LSTKKVIAISLRILVVCLLFAVCFTIGGALSGLSRVAQQAPSSQSTQADFLLPFLILSFSVGIVVSYLVLRSSWHGWKLACAIFVAMYGISTIASQTDSIFFLSTKLPQGMIPALFLQGAIATVMFAPLAVVVLGKWQAASTAHASPEQTRMRASSIAWRIVLLVVAFVFLYMFFGYYVAWQNPVLRQYYGGSAYSSFFEGLQLNLANNRWIYPLQVFRALLYLTCAFPLIRMLRATRWEKAAAIALFLAAWTTALLMPNPLMPMSVARSHFWETMGFSLTFGALLGWLLSQTTASGDTKARTM